MAEEVNERIRVDLEGVGMSGSLPVEFSYQYGRRYLKFGGRVHADNVVTVNGVQYVVTAAKVKEKETGWRCEGVYGMRVSSVDPDTGRVDWQNREFTDGARQKLYAWAEEQADQVASFYAEEFARSIISATGETMRARVHTYGNYLALGQLAYTEAAAMAVVAGRSPDEITVKPAEGQRVAAYASLSPAADKPMAAGLIAEIWVQNELAAIEVEFVNPPPRSRRLFFLPPWALTEGAEYLTCKETAAKIKERNSRGHDT